MLTEDDKTRIKEEEIFRAEVQKEVSQNSWKIKIWKFINSAIFLWFLGSVAVAVIVAWQDSKNQARESAALASKLDIEIGSRIYRLRGYMKRLENVGGPLNVSDVLRNTGPVRDQPYPMGVFSEYKERTLESLLWELSQLVSSKSSKTSVREALNAARRLREIQAGITIQTPGESKQKLINQVIGELDESFALERWNVE